MLTINNRSLEPYQLVHVYYNLHKGGYSIRDHKTRLVLAHVNNVLLSNCSFIVSENSRQKVLSCNRKNVHAYIKGYYIDSNINYNTNDLNKIYYNPYETMYFTNMNTREYIYNSDIVYCINKLSYAK